MIGGLTVGGLGLISTLAGPGGVWGLRGWLLAADTGLGGPGGPSGLGGLFG